MPTPTLEDFMPRGELMSLLPHVRFTGPDLAPAIDSLHGDVMEGFNDDGGDQGKLDSLLSPSVPERENLLSDTRM